MTKGDDSATNVRVAIRTRPFNAREKNMNAAKCTKIVNPAVYITDPKTKKERQYTYDFAYDWDVDQDKVYEDVGKSILESSFQGYNGTIFAYGQTGSGKTYSVMGSSDNPGIIPKMNLQLFERVHSEATAEQQFLVTVSFLEIYNEEVHDLLNPSDAKLEIREHPEMGIFVENLAEIVVKSHADIMDMMRQGDQVRQVAETAMNARSSRSHSVFTVKIQQRSEETNDEDNTINTRVLSSKINLVDLAGSERAGKTEATGARLKEGAMINRSLSALGNVINALSDGKGHIPYRDSKLTRILQESLGGNTQTIMIAAISPADDNHDETLSTLQYANRAKAIQNKAVKNEDQNQRVIRELREQLMQLRAMVGQSGSEEGRSNKQVEEMEQKMNDLELAKRQTWEEKERISRLYEQERVQNMQNKGLIDLVLEARRDRAARKEKIQGMKRERETLMGSFNEQKERLQATRQALQEKAEGYSKFVKEDAKNKSSDKARELVQEINILKEDLKSTSEEAKQSKENLKALSQKIKFETEEYKAQQSVLAEDESYRKQVQQDEKARVQSENEQFLAEEAERLRRETERERERITEEATMRGIDHAGQAGSVEELTELRLQLIQEKGDKNVLLTKIAVAEKRLERAREEIEQTKKYGQEALERSEMLYLEIFSQYRKHFEEQKARLESKYKELLAEITNDCVLLSSQNQELLDKVSRLETAGGKRQAKKG